MVGIVDSTDAAAIDLNNSIGGVMTSNGAADTKGAYDEAIASTSEETYWVHLSFKSVADDIGFLIDFAVGAAASESVKVADIMLTERGGQVKAMEFSFPLTIANGSRVALRCQDSSGGQTVEYTVHLSNDSTMGTSTASLTMGADTANSQGVSVPSRLSQNITSIANAGGTSTMTYTGNAIGSGGSVIISGTTAGQYDGTFAITGIGANTFDITHADNGDDTGTVISDNTKSAYVELDANTSIEINYLIVVWGPNLNFGVTPTQSCLFDLAEGAASSESDTIPNVSLDHSASEPPPIPRTYVHTISSGTRVSVRFQNDNAVGAGGTDSIKDCIAYGFTVSDPAGGAGGAGSLVNGGLVN